MTNKEKRDTSILNASRRKRIALGSGTSVEDVNRLLKSFEEMNKMMKQLTGGMFKKGKKGRMKIPFQF